jgi:hypothetical protein
VHDQATTSATAGNRTAIALHGVSREDVTRGDWLVAPGRFHATETGRPRGAPPAAGPSPTGRACASIWCERDARPRSFSVAEEAPSGRAAALAQLRLEAPSPVQGTASCSAPARPPSRLPGHSRRREPAPARTACGRDPGGSSETLETGDLAERVALLTRQAGFRRTRRRRGGAGRLGAEPAAVEAAASRMPSLLRLGRSVARSRGMGGARPRDRRRGAPLWRRPTACGTEPRRGS